MVKATFNGNAENRTYQCAEFHARAKDTVWMPNARWTAIGTEGKQGLFTVLVENEDAFPAQTTVGPKV